MFDPTKRIAYRLEDLEQARFWFEVRLHLKALAIIAPFAALAFWAMVRWL